MPLSRAKDFDDDDSKGPQYHYGFGSWHPGICTFLLGDGSVRSISSDTTFSIIRALSRVSDGESVAVP
jgi:hypothetical protein